MSTPYDEWETLRARGMVALTATDTLRKGLAALADPEGVDARRAEEFAALCLTLPNDTLAERIDQFAAWVTALETLRSS